MEIELTLPEDRPAPRDLPALLRALGAVVVALSLSAFLFENWTPGDDLQRYLMLLGQTAILAALGIASGRLMHETKGARTFLALALLAVPVNFTILGALLYSLQGSTASLPEVATWRAGEPTALYLTAAAALPLLAAVALFAMRVLSRRSAPRLAALLFGLNALLLLPTRDADTIGGLLAAATIAALLGAVRIGRDDPARRTLEGGIARASLLLPPLILAGRSLWFHQADTLLLTAVALSLYLLLRATTLELPATSAWRRFLEPLSTLPAGLTACGGAVLVTPISSGEQQLIVGVMILAGLLFELSTRAINGAPYRWAATITAGGGVTLNLLLHGGALNALAALAVGGALLAHGFSSRRRGPLLVGLAVTAIGLIHQIVQITTLFHVGTWGGLALLGIATIVAGSLIERHGPRLRAEAARWRERFDG